MNVGSPPDFNSGRDNLRGSPEHESSRRACPFLGSDDRASTLLNVLRPSSGLDLGQPEPHDVETASDVQKLGGAGWTRTSDRRIMRAPGRKPLTRANAFKRSTTWPFDTSWILFLSRPCSTLCGLSAS